MLIVFCLVTAKITSSATLKHQGSFVRAAMLLPKLPGELGAVGQPTLVQRSSCHSMGSHGGWAWAHFACDVLPAHLPPWSQALPFLDIKLSFKSGNKKRQKKKEKCEDVKCGICCGRPLGCCLTGAQHCSSCVQTSKWAVCLAARRQINLILLSGTGE